MMAKHLNLLNDYFASVFTKRRAAILEPATIFKRKNGEGRACLILNLQVVWWRKN